MNNSKFETKRRLRIIDDFKIKLEKDVIAIQVGGSMGFGQNFSVNENSDIDTVLIIERDDVNKLLENNFFKGKINFKVAELFRNKVIDFFWITKIINNVEVNFFIYDKESYVNFCLLKGDLKGFINFKPNDLQTGFCFDGEKIVFSRNVQKIDDGYLYQKPCLVNDKYWGGVPRQDFFYSNFIVYEKDNFLSNLENEVWRRTILKLKEEIGDKVDLDKFNILNTHYTYQTQRNRFPQGVINKIKERTQKEFTSNSK